MSMTLRRLLLAVQIFEQTLSILLSGKLLNIKLNALINHYQKFSVLIPCKPFLAHRTFDRLRINRNSENRLV